MQKGRIDQIVNRGNNVLVIDIELLIYQYRKWGIIKKFLIAPFATRIIKWIKKNEGEFDEIIIGASSTSSFLKFAYEKLKLPYTYVDMDGDFNYSQWLNIISPKKHLATLHHRYYHQSSHYVDLSFFKEQNIVED